MPHSPDRSHPLPRRILRRLPASWAADLKTVAAAPITTGMGGAEVFLLRTAPETILKLATGKRAAMIGEEIERLRWLAGQGIAVPSILRAHADARIGAMQMQKLPGVPADHPGLAAGQFLPALARALAALHALPVDGCQFDESLPVRLARAQRAVERGEVDVDQFDEKNLGADPQVLLAKLQRDPPAEDLVVNHGDAAFSNIIVDGDRIGFIDCGQCGRADRYLDLAIIGAEILERFGRRGLATFAAAYGERVWDERKAAYYRDLYEFF